MNLTDQSNETDQLDLLYDRYTKNVLNFIYHVNIIVQLTKLLGSLFLPLINHGKKDQLELNSDKIHAVFLQAFILSFGVCLKQEKWNDLIPKYEHNRSKRSTELLVLTIDTIRLVANSLSCARTKSISIVLNVSSPYFTQQLLGNLKKSTFFPLLYDASNKGNTKVFPICVQFLSSTGVKIGIVDLIDAVDEPTIEIFANARQLFMDNGLDIYGLTALGVDNTNVNIGNNHSVYSLFKDELPNVLKGNCYSHILPNSVKYAHNELLIDGEKVLISLCYHYLRSAKRVDELKQYYGFYEQDFKVILKHTKLRWLSLYLSIERLVEVFALVKIYFLE
ncbi:unnamed protein product [Rotaria sp. Silwood2]|nr:unnamed protein product [Rotaria sp. Silwood2]